MLRKGAIDAQHLWKRFRADRRRRLVRDNMDLAIDRLRRRGRRGWRWALRDIDLSIEPGESVALIGPNGSGKTTLLKLLARVMYPYAGSLRLSGRVGALIEVRAGIHQDLTGRENAFLYGSLLGLPRREVAKRFDDIVAFAELEDAIDRQVKYYSVGMQMRLGFSVASSLDPDILLVDEVLAVGDAAFQQRCLDRIRHVLSEGTTLIFVSHDLAAVEATCTRGMWLEEGRVAQTGDIRDVLASYRRAVEEDAVTSLGSDGLVRLRSIEAVAMNGDPVRTGGPLDITLRLESQEARTGILCVGVSEGTASPIFLVRRDLSIRSGETEVRCHVPLLPLPGGRFYVWTGVFDTRAHDLLPWHPSMSFHVSGPDLDATPIAIPRMAPVHVDASWDLRATR